MRKADIREEIKTLTHEYLMRGNKIEIVPPKRFLTAANAWMEKYGWDYLPWNVVCDDSVLGYTYWLGDGGYLTKPQHMED